ncbi:MAG: sn-glycerol-1-phosphate dehydrogenase [Bacteroidales bacterium]|nr:sn-glycerol-1-phosphate dehydrogenase [Bacteroidales bacterium]
MNSQERIAAALKVSTDTRAFELGRGNLDKVPALFNKYFEGRTAIVVADNNTWRVAGSEVFEHFSKSGIPTQKFLFTEDEFHADWEHIETLDKVLDESGAIAVSVGSGTINDLCKLCSHHHGQSYLTVPTAASVDGYTSFGASITYQNAKQTFECPAPVAVVADVDVIAAAPKEMTAAGYADLAAKVPAGAEWMIADVVGAEPIIPDAWHVLQDCLDELLGDPEGVAAGEPKAISDLFEGLILSGFAMQAARSSRPASCCDHLFSHILDMTHHRYKGKFVSHGFQVAIGTLTMCAVLEHFVKYNLEDIDIDACVAAWPTLESEQQRALEIFKDFPAPKLGYENIAKKYSDAAAVRKELEAVKAVWSELKARIAGQNYSFAKMQKLFKIVGAPYEPEHIGITRSDIQAMFPIVQLMRWRYNVLDLAKRLRLYDDLVDSVFTKGGAWEL